MDRTFFIGGGQQATEMLPDSVTSGQVVDSEDAPLLQHTFPFSTESPRQSDENTGSNSPAALREKISPVHGHPRVNNQVNLGHVPVQPIIPVNNGKYDDSSTKFQMSLLHLTPESYPIFPSSQNSKINQPISQHQVMYDAGNVAEIGFYRDSLHQQYNNANVNIPDDRPRKNRGQFQVPTTVFPYHLQMTASDTGHAQDRIQERFGKSEILTPMKNYSESRKQENPYHAQSREALPSLTITAVPEPTQEGHIFSRTPNGYQGLSHESRREQRDQTTVTNSAFVEDLLLHSSEPTLSAVTPFPYILQSLLEQGPKNQSLVTLASNSYVRDPLSATLNYYVLSQLLSTSTETSLLRTKLPNETSGVSAKYSETPFVSTAPTQPSSYTSISQLQSSAESDVLVRLFYFLSK
ncbi:hypothetical protein KIN20_007489 [Parelaphostrongylus tenuis]|uniref:Uncharacterized protein n=1 Tax=Parelaphostrongylus tenuis TaxID=148309 RepID=A0AAD5MVM1_PARTN|nr:hypothetical protein KIN20_007489 [Parelaphostrongylus tenuis]